MSEYCACGNLKLVRRVPACKKCFEFWGDLFPDKAGIECDIGDVTGTLDDGDIWETRDGAREKVIDEDTLIILFSAKSKL
jgi:hypothetical protein